MRLHVGANGSWPIAFAVGSLIGYWMSTVASGMPIWKWRDTGKRQRLQHHVPDHFGKLGPESGLATLLILFSPAPTHFQTDPAGISGLTHSTRRKPPSKSPQYVLLNQWVRPFLEPVFEYLPRSRQQCVRLGRKHGVMCLGVRGCGAACYLQFLSPLPSHQMKFIEICFSQ